MPMTTPRAPLTPTPAARQRRYSKEGTLPAALTPEESRVKYADELAAVEDSPGDAMQPQF